jgi:hypothetical protein
LLRPITDNDDFVPSDRDEGGEHRGDAAAQQLPGQAGPAPLTATPTPLRGSVRLG